MATNNPDKKITQHIEELVSEEHRLRASKAPSSGDRERLASIEIELDQCWDLLRQRRALREFGDDPNQARVRPADIVEKYEQ